MRRRLLLLLALCACSSPDARSTDAPAASAGAGSIPEAAVPTKPVAATEQTVINASLIDPVLSTVAKAGDTVFAQVMGHVTDAAGYVVIPSTSPVKLRVVKLEAAKAGAGTTAVAELVPIAVTVRNVDVPISATVAPIAAQVTAAGVVLVDRGTTITFTLSKPLTVEPPPN